MNYKTRMSDILNEMHLAESKKALDKKADKSGMPKGILSKVYDRGMAAWKGGHRPGTTPQQWALARVNSFITKSSGTWGGADSDLAKQVKGRAESVEEARQLKDKDTEMMVVKHSKVIVIDKSDWNEYKSKGYKIAESYESFIDEALEVKYDKTKQGWFDKQGRRRYLGIAATNAIMKKKIDLAIKTGDWTTFDIKKEEVQFNLEEVQEKYDSDKFFSGKGTPEQRLKLLKLQNKSLRAPPSSPKQQAIKQEINALRKEIGMKVTEDEYAALDSFTNNLNLSPEEDAKIASNQYEDDDELMAKLMDHFSDEMPYGTQKGRDGDPYEFIFQELDSMGLIKEELGEAKSSDDLQQAVNAAIAMFKRSGRGGEQIIPSENFDGFNDDEAMAGIRHWGNWENPQDEEDEEDYDWQDPTDETYEKATKLIAQISKQFPDIKFELGVEEKNTMIVSAKHKVKEDNVAEMTFSQLKGSLKGKVMSDEKLEELKQLIEKHGLAEVSKMFSIDARELQAMTESNFTESINDILHLSGIKK